MKKSTVIWIVTAIALVIAGGIIFTCALGSVGFDFSALDNREYSTDTVNITESFEGVSVDTSVTDINILPSEDGVCKAVVYCEDKIDQSIEVIDSLLVIKENKGYEWYDYILPNFRTPAVTLYLPEAEYSKLLVDTNTGDVSVSGGVSFDDINIVGDTADILLSDIDCTSLTCELDTGDIVLRNVVADGKFSFITDTGDIDFYACDADEIYARTSTGDVEATLLTGKDFECKSSTGDVEIPRNSSGGKCEIRCSTGDIEIEVLK